MACAGLEGEVLRLRADVTALTVQAAAFRTYTDRVPARLVRPVL